MKKDIITKEIVETITYDIAKLILELDISDIKFVDKELKRVEKREADIVALCKIDGIEQILHIEIQNNNDMNMHYRMLRYYVDIKSKFKNLKINQYLIYIGKDNLKMPNNISDDSLSFRYNVVDMKLIDCEKFISLDTPDALVMSILCDFKNKNEVEILTFLIKRLKELTKDDLQLFNKYMLMIETLSENRDLKDKIKEAEAMLREINYENLPSYEIGLERGLERGLEKGIERGIERGIENAKFDSAIIMVDKFHLSIEDVARELKISMKELENYIKMDNK